VFDTILVTMVPQEDSQLQSEGISSNDQGFHTVIINMV